jgi:hypothetical protein
MVINSWTKCLLQLEIFASCLDNAFAHGSRRNVDAMIHGNSNKEINPIVIAHNVP